MTTTMDLEQQTCESFRRRREEPSLNLREWATKAHNIRRENTKSRRFSASNITSFREDYSKSFKSNVTISSTASSPGYNLKDDQIDPTTYSFTTALRALQSRSGHGWECLSPDGLALNSKWNEAERYICNPLSGEVPIECLSSKTLSGRSSIHSLTSRITMSGPLGYSSHSRLIQTKTTITQEEEADQPPIQERKEGSLTRDVGTQSTDICSSSPSPTSTPSIKERSLKLCKDESGESPNSCTKSKSDEEIEEKEKREKEEEQVSKKDKKMCIKCRQVDCLSWMKKWQRVKHKPSWKFCFG